MIYTKPDVEILKRVLVRKGCEASAVKLNPNLTEMQRTMLSAAILRDVDRTQLMLSIGLNDFQGLELRMRELEEDISVLPPSLYSAYMSVMSDADREDESAYMFMFSILLAYTPVINAGIVMADRLAAADPIMHDPEIMAIRRCMDIMLDIVDRCDMESGDLDDAAEFADAIAAACSLLLRISAGKPAPCDQIALSLAEMGSVDDSLFREVFMDELDPDVRTITEALCDPRGVYAAVLCGRCILNGSMPLQAQW